MPLFELLLCVALVLISGFLSSSEIALFSLSRFQLRSLKDQISSTAFRKIRKLSQDPGGLLVTILVLNEIVNISLSSIITQTLAQQPGKSDPTYWLTHLLLGSAISTAIILLFCEVTPKTIGAKVNRLIATLSASPLSTIYFFMKPVRVVLTRIISLISKALSKSGAQKESTVLKESEFLLMLEEGHKEGAVQKSEIELIKNVFELDDTRVDSIYTPLSQVRSLAASATVASALASIRGSIYSRIPVLSPNRAQIIGILYVKDLLRAKLEQGMTTHPISEVMRKPLVVQPSMQLNALFRRFKQNRTHMAVVQKPTGEPLGIVTMNDVLDSLFEDLLPDEEEQT